MGNRASFPGSHAWVGSQMLMALPEGRKEEKQQVFTATTCTHPVQSLRHSLAMPVEPTLSSCCLYPLCPRFGQLASSDSSYPPHTKQGPPLAWPWEWWAVELALILMSHPGPWPKTPESLKLPLSLLRLLVSMINSLLYLSLTEDIASAAANNVFFVSQRHKWFSRVVYRKRTQCHNILSF